jgi:hypothetical protein
MKNTKSSQDRQDVKLPLDSIKRNVRVGNSGELDDCINLYRERGGLRPFKFGKANGFHGIPPIHIHRGASFVNYIGGLNMDIVFLSGWTPGTITNAASVLGINRVFIVMVTAKSASTRIYPTSVTFGGRLMGKAVEYILNKEAPLNKYLYTGIYIMKEVILDTIPKTQTAATRQITVNWNTPPDGIDVCSVLLGNVDQGDSLVTAKNYVYGARVTTPPILTQAGGMAILCGVTEANNETTLDNDFILRRESNSEWGDGIYGYKYGRGANETPSVSHSEVNYMALCSLSIIKAPPVVAMLRQNGINTYVLLYRLRTGETVLEMNEIGNYLIVATSRKLLRFLFDVDSMSYNLIDINDGLTIGNNIDKYYLFAEDIQEVETETIEVSADENDENWETWRQTHITNIYKKINEESNKGRIAGCVSVRLAVRLNNGSYILHTLPLYKKAEHTVPYSIQYDPGEPFVELPDGTPLNFMRLYKFHETSPDKYYQTVFFHTATYKVTLRDSIVDMLKVYEKLIDSVVIFFSKAIIKYDFEAMIKDTEGLTKPGVEVPYFDDANYLIKSGDYINAADPILWYKVGEIPISEIKEATGSVSHTIVPTRFYQDYGTREKLPVDQFSHHDIQADVTFLYNSRLWIAGAKRTLARPSIAINQNGPTNDTVDLRFVVRIKTSSGIKQVVSTVQNVNVNIVYENGTPFFRELKFWWLGYPDSRAFEIVVHIYKSNVWRRLLKVSLKASLYNNYSYSDSGDIETNVVWTGNVNLNFLPLSSVSELLENRLDIVSPNLALVSELYNPLVFPAIHAYPVGEGRVLYFSAMGYPVSEGQFGEYPVHIYTSTGTYAARIGTGDVIVTSVVPVSPHVALCRPVGTAKGSFFITSKGIILIVGSKSIEISAPLESDLSPVLNSAGNSFSIIGSNTVPVINSLIVNIRRFNDALSQMILGYDSINDRLFVSIPSADYTYICDINNNMQWFRISEGYRYFSNDHPTLFGHNQSNSMIDLTVEDRTGVADCFFRSKVFDMGINHRKKIDEGIFVCNIKVPSSYKGCFAIFASNDGQRFSLVSANNRQGGRDINDIQVSYCPASYKFFVATFWGRLDCSFDNVIDRIELQVEVRYRHRLRSY